MRVLVCGGRDLDSSIVRNWLEAHATELCADALNRASHVQITHVIQGGATGADSGAERWAQASNIPVTSFRGGLAALRPAGGSSAECPDDR